MLVKQGKKYSLLPDSLVNAEKLPKGVYEVTFDAQRGVIELSEEGDFTLPTKVYGNVAQKCEKILNTYQDREGNTGVLLIGLKGTGKTMLAKAVAINSGLPILTVNSPIPFAPLTMFLSKLQQPVVVLFDEFEKVYFSGEKDGEGDDVAQTGVLALLNGTYNTNCLFLLTCNNEMALHSKLLNRPGRIYYRFRYDSLDLETYNEIVEDLLKTSLLKKYKEEFSRAYMVLGDVSVDTLKSLVEEVNRYDISPSEAVKDLNIDRENISYEITAVSETNVMFYDPHTKTQETRVEKIKFEGEITPNKDEPGHPAQVDSYRDIYLNGHNSQGGRVNFYMEMCKDNFEEVEDSNPYSTERTFLYKDGDNLTEVTFKQIKTRSRFYHLAF